MLWRWGGHITLLWRTTFTLYLRPQFPLAIYARKKLSSLFLSKHNRILLSSLFDNANYIFQNAIKFVLEAKNKTKKKKNWQAHEYIMLMKKGNRNAFYAFRKHSFGLRQKHSTPMPLSTSLVCYRTDPNAMPKNSESKECLVPASPTGGSASTSPRPSVVYDSLNEPAEYVLSPIEKKFLLTAERGDCPGVRL